MYTIRIKNVDSIIYDIITNKEGLYQQVILLDSSDKIEKYQVWSAGIGMVNYSGFGWGIFTKWVTASFFNN